MNPTEWLLESLDEAFDRPSWHGTNLRGSLRGVKPAEALWRPAPGRHNIWEIVLHTAYWKYRVRRRLLGEKQGSFVLAGNNWFERSDGLSSQLWRREIGLLEAEHRQLREAVLSLTAADLDKPAGGDRYRVRQLIRGGAAHDLYHAGQIQLLKRLLRNGPPSEIPGPSGPE